MKHVALGILIVLAAAAAWSCTTASDDVCIDLKKKLGACGVPSTDLDCSRLDTSAQEDLVSRIDQSGCAGAASSPTSSDVDPRICALGRFPCPPPPTPAPTDKKPIYPVVFVSGIDSSDLFAFSPRIFEALARRGIAVEHVKLSSWATTEERGPELWGDLVSIRRRLGAAKVNLIGYAVGGLDCRWVASEPSRREALASITTVATPHRGTRVADASLDALRSGATADVVASLVGAAAPSSLPDQSALAKTLEGLTVEALSGDVPEIDGVYVQSFAGVSHVLGKTSAASERTVQDACIDSSGAFSFFRHEGNEDSLSELLVLTSPFAGAPADGMVSVDSAKWGNFRGCIPADHYDVIGQMARISADPVTGFDAPRFYEWVISDLAERGY